MKCLAMAAVFVIGTLMGLGAAVVLPERTRTTVAAFHESLAKPPDDRDSLTHPHAHPIPHVHPTPHVHHAETHGGPSGLAMLHVSGVFGVVNFGADPEVAGAHDSALCGRPQ